MQTCHKSIITFLLLFCSVAIFAQDKPKDVATLLKEGMDLNKDLKFTEAIAKFDEALKIDPNNADAIYDKGLALALDHKETEALPYFEKVVAVNPVTARPQAYIALGNVYSVQGNFEKGIYYFTKVIGVQPRNASVWHSLGSDYLRSNQFAQAQAAATEAIKIDPSQQNNYPLYAYGALTQGKNAEGLLALFNFIMLASPKEKQSVEASRTIKKILHQAPVADAGPIAKMQQQTIAKAVLSATAGKTNLTPPDSLSLQLISVFKAIKEQQDQYGSPFFSKYFGNFFDLMATTDHVNTVSHIITDVILSPTDNNTWLKEHGDQIGAWINWMKNTQRETE